MAALNNTKNSPIIAVSKSMEGKNLLLWILGLEDYLTKLVTERNMEMILEQMEELGV